MSSQLSYAPQTSSAMAAAPLVYQTSDYNQLSHPSAPAPYANYFPSIELASSRGPSTVNPEGQRSHTARQGNHMARYSRRLPSRDSITLISKTEKASSIMIEDDKGRKLRLTESVEKFILVQLMDEDDEHATFILHSLNDKEMFGEGLDKLIQSLKRLPSNFCLLQLWNGSNRRRAELKFPLKIFAQTHCHDDSIDTDSTTAEPFPKVVVKTAFTSPMDSEVFREGDALEVIDKAKFEGWYYVRKESMKHEANAVCLCPAFIFDLSEFEISKRFCKTSAEPFMILQARSDSDMADTDAPSAHFQSPPPSKVSSSASGSSADGHKLVPGCLPYRESDRREDLILDGVLESEGGVLSINC
uniref:SH3 domain-containing protein n=1 Tax=Hanusia phi TaxID=3032 RepID=A0A7S0ERI2_9CRYP